MEDNLSRVNHFGGTNFSSNLLWSWLRLMVGSFSCKDGRYSIQTRGSLKWHRAPWKWAENFWPSFFEIHKLWFVPPCCLFSFAISWFFLCMVLVQRVHEEQELQPFSFLCHKCEHGRAACVAAGIYLLITQKDFVVGLSALKILDKKARGRSARGL